MDTVDVGVQNFQNTTLFEVTPSSLTPSGKVASPMRALRHAHSAFAVVSLNTHNHAKLFLVRQSNHGLGD